jgi:hypothetical protein
VAKGDSRALELIDLGDKLFSEKKQYDGLCQEIAFELCPDLADFTAELVLGQDFAAGRMDSYPEQMSRELTNQMAAMLRPNDRPWFKCTTLDETVDAVEENARYLEYVTKVIRQGMYDPRSKFIRATKQADRFYVNFGQAVISVEEAPGNRDHLFFRNYHNKNCAWLENDLSEIDNLHRKEQITARAMTMKFRADKLDPKVKEMAEKKPGQKLPMRVVVMPAEEYDLTGPEGKRGNRKLPFVVVYIDVENRRVIREGGLPSFNYVVPRWMLFGETQYAFSPAAMIALPDSRMAQMMSQIILEAGEKSVEPPMVAKQQVVIGEPNIQAGGISWVDLEHDASLKDALDAIRLEPDMKTAFAMRQDLREMLTKAFFVDKLKLPEAGKDMTAYEVGRRLEEHVRNLLPLIEPMQVEYNTRLLDKSYSVLMNMRKFRTDGADGTPPMPQALASADVTWAFQSPIEQAQEQILVEYFKGALELEQLGMQAGAEAPCIKVDRAMIDAIRGMGTPAAWRKSQDEMRQDAAKIAQQKQMQGIMGTIGQGAQVAEQAGKAGQALGLMPPAQKDVPVAPQALQAARGAQAAGLNLGPDVMKAIQGSAQGNPEQAGRAGMPAADVGDQGPPQTSGGVAPAPWQPEQPEALLQSVMGIGRQPQQGQPTQEGAPPAQATPAQLEPQQPGMMPSDVAHMLRQISTQLAYINDAIHHQMSKPKQVEIKREGGKIVGASIGH